MVSPKRYFMIIQAKKMKGFSWKAPEVWFLTIETKWHSQLSVLVQTSNFSINFAMIMVIKDVPSMHTKRSKAGDSLSTTPM